MILFRERRHICGFTEVHYGSGGSSRDGESVFRGIRDIKESSSKAPHYSDGNNFRFHSCFTSRRVTLAQKNSQYCHSKPYSDSFWGQVLIGAYRRKLSTYCALDDHVANKRPNEFRYIPANGYTENPNGPKTVTNRSHQDSLRLEKADIAVKGQLDKLERSIDSVEANDSTKVALRPHHIVKLLDSLVFFDDILRNDPLCEAAVDLVESLARHWNKEKNSTNLDEEQEEDDDSEDDEEDEMEKNELEEYESEDLVSAISQLAHSDRNSMDHSYFSRTSVLPLGVSLSHHGKKSASLFEACKAYLKVLADFNNSWEDHFIQLVLFYSNNSFTRACIRAEGIPSKLQPCIVASACRDLFALEQLYRHLNPDILSYWVNEVSPELGQLFYLDSNVISSIHQVKDKDDIALAELMKESSSRWPELVEELIKRYGKRGCGVFAVNYVFRYVGTSNNPFLPLESFDAVNLDELIGIEEHKVALMKNIEFFLSGKRAHNVLLIGSRGTGKSSLVKAVAQATFERGLRIIQLDDALELRELRNSYSELFHLPHRFLIFMDDIGADMTSEEIRAIKSVMEGGLQTMPSNMIIVATCNRRSLLFPEIARAESSYRYRGGEDVNMWDAEEERLGLGERFGLVLTFAPPDSKRYIQVVKHLAHCYSLNPYDDFLIQRAVDFAKRKNSYSGRTAKQFIIQIWSEQAYLQDSWKSHKNI
ncbi:ATPase with chaperone activity [Galdieria sulphuraria]|uniref:ATPase with chaperone activity n=1 Tax=Galdieria sulphuraria TaxID=130081 RepID=M2Y817_GALSU|nr:ATPase with chaperone activity [Galdieria sulphuraria]EME31974.1 ATPase with chaperone activity [Galdieria sulphuraria]|eukprot:XP_005708494.1 ATPase with chaperone activity [Galdieria sulphuraria]